MLGSVVIASALLGITGEQQAALEALIAQRQAARIAREQTAAELRKVRMWDFYTLQTRKAKVRKVDRQERLASRGARPRPDADIFRMQREAVEAAYWRQFQSPVILGR